MYMYIVCTACVSDGVEDVTTTDIPHHLEAMVELLCEEDSQKTTREHGTMVHIAAAES